MRAKLIAVFALIVLIVGGLSYAVVRASIGSMPIAANASRGLVAANAQLQLDGLMLERWLTSQAANPKVLEPFNAGTASARAESATGVANVIRNVAKSNNEFAGMPLAVVLLVDKQGVVLGRDGSALMRGDDVGSAYPHLKEALSRGVSGSDVWINRQRNEQLLVSYASVRGGDGQVQGGIVVGTTLNDERLSNASGRTSGNILIVAVPSGDGLDIVAKSEGATQELVTALGQGTAKEGVLRALTSGSGSELGGLPKSYSGSSRPLDGYGDGKRAILIGVVQVQTAAIVSSLSFPLLGVIALGLLLVIAAASLLDSYVSRPVSEIEDGLLAIMNGKTDLRFEIEHPEFGGLAFRLNSLLNQLFGVQEDETDDQGRPSRAPSSGAFQDALAVDEQMAALPVGDVADAQALRAENDEVYYKRIFKEYIAGKKSLGDPVDHITREAFIARIAESERELARKHGKPFRYKVEVRGKEVVLLAVPLA